MTIGLIEDHNNFTINSATSPASEREENVFTSWTISNFCLGSVIAPCPGLAAQLKNVPGRNKSMK